MRRIGPCVLAALVAMAAPRDVFAQFGRAGLNLSIAGGANLPVGDLDRSAQPGFGIAVRTESGGAGEPWSVRGGLSYDRFSGKGTVDAYEYLTFASGDLVHHTNRKLYQFAGVGFYQAKTITGTQTRSESDFGFQAGVGLNIGTRRTTFIELGVVNVLTAGRTSAWFPLRVGIRL